MPHRIIIVDLISLILGTAGAFTIGELLPPDTAKDYGTAAGAHYKPFISDLEMAKYRTSRTLHKRLLSYRLPLHGKSS